MRKGVCVLLALLFAGAAAGAGGCRAVRVPCPSSRQRPRAPPARPPSGVPPSSLSLDAPPRVELSASAEDKRLFHQPGDPDSLFTLGKPSPQGEVRLLAVVDVNEIFLKAIPPDPLVQGRATRARAPPEASCPSTGRGGRTSFDWGRASSGKW